MNVHSPDTHEFLKLCLGDITGYIRVDVNGGIEWHPAMWEFQRPSMKDPVADVISGIQFSSLPSSYIRPESQRPKLSEVVECDNVPIIDLGCEDRSLIIKQIGDACREYGFFQVINHGVSKEMVDKILGVAHEFFGLPVEEKMKLYSDDPSKTMRLSTSFNVKKETVHNWRDYLRLHCYPLDKYAPEWPSNPSFFKRARATHGMNYYPACPEPELTYGLPTAITILLQDLQVAGLQVLKDGKWLAIKPQPDAFVINIGDQLQALSNGMYKSVWHRAVVNADKARLSVASFLCPCDSADISAPKGLTSGEDGAVYRDFTYAEYYKKFWSRNLDQEHCLELFKN
ncbi:Flavanone 3-dioxygenase 2 [Sesamum angolense]|uniref:Flavanone 3-dioxygenase 2 n=1 Tax=Sesamum angolense TaxID=2727404 RepID=A0AAE2C6Y8_9LAMI|nr:Flavanone 3-dioxygenase 2 [Sesamum angolense]